MAEPLTGGTSGSVRLRFRSPAARAASIFATICAIYACAAASRERSPSSSTSVVASLGPVAVLDEEASDAPPDGETESEVELVLDAGAPFPRVRDVGGVYFCTTTRPRLCDATPSPVCAHRIERQQNSDAGTEHDADSVNGCLACADPSVTSYRRGRCADRGATPLSTSATGSH